MIQTSIVTTIKKAIIREKDIAAEAMAAAALDLSVQIVLAFYGFEDRKSGISRKESGDSHR